MTNDGYINRSRLETLRDCRLFAIRIFGSGSFAVEFIDAHIAVYGADLEMPFSFKYMSQLLERKHKEGVDCGKEAAREMLRERRDFPFFSNLAFLPLPQYNGTGIAGLAGHIGGNFQGINARGGMMVEGRSYSTRNTQQINPVELKIRLDRDLFLIVAEAECGEIYTIDYLGWLVLKEKVEAAIKIRKELNIELP